jgi:hypothetical protein
MHRLSHFHYLQFGRAEGIPFTTTSSMDVLYMQGVEVKGVGPSMTLAWPGWKQPDIAVEVNTGRQETDVGRQEF